MKQMARGRRREAIISAALACAAEVGWGATSLQAVRQRAGVSNGTLFHYFPTRQHLETAALAAGLAGHQSALLAELETSSSARDGVVRVVQRHLRWVQDHQELAQLLLAQQPQTLRVDLDETALEANRRFFAEVADWLRAHGWSGQPELAVLVALWIGPAQDYVRGWSSLPEHPLEAASALAEGAWRALDPLLRGEAP